MKPWVAEALICTKRIQLVKVLHLNPARHYPFFIDAAKHVTNLQLWMLALSALDHMFQWDCERSNPEALHALSCSRI
jgi:hypothetical protein